MKNLIYIFLLLSLSATGQTWEQYFNVPNINTKFGVALSTKNIVFIADSVAYYKINHITQKTDSMKTVFRNSWCTRITLTGSSQWTTYASGIYYNSGNVGIGTTNPSFTFEAYSSDPSDNIYSRIKTSDYSSQLFNRYAYSERPDSILNESEILTSTAGVKFGLTSFYNDWKAYFNLNPDTMSVIPYSTDANGEAITNRLGLGTNLSPWGTGYLEKLYLKSPRYAASATRTIGIDTITGELVKIPNATGSLWTDNGNEKQTSNRDTVVAQVIYATDLIKFPSGKIESDIEDVIVAMRTTSDENGHYQGVTLSQAQKFAMLISNGVIAQAYVNVDTNEAGLYTQGKTAVLDSNAFFTDINPAIYRLNLGKQANPWDTTYTRNINISGDKIGVRTSKTPSSATDTGNAGDWCWDANYIYICTATNTWKRTAISTW